MLTAVPCSLLSCPLPKLAAVAHKNGSRLRWAEAAAGAAAATATAAAENENLTTAQRDALFVCAAATRRFPWPRCCLGCLGCLAACCRRRRRRNSPDCRCPSTPPPSWSGVWPAFQQFSLFSLQQACRRLAPPEIAFGLQAGWLAGWNFSLSIALSLSLFRPHCCCCCRFSISHSVHAARRSDNDDGGGSGCKHFCMTD